ncbi:hypothetical protein H0H87_005565 [Tephrocybe sp. NHM501043]|nr:hypothetical protein H0H87_005565 [Tephrocybe sp. NHM501043]
MLSGIGKYRNLKKLGIKTILNLPDVGSNLLDHPFVALQWSVNSNNTNDALNQFPGLLQMATAQYNLERQGPLANNPGANSIGFFRLPKSSKALKGRNDPATGPRSPHFELTFGVNQATTLRLLQLLLINFCSQNSFLSFTQTPPTTGNYFSMLIAATSPQSRL